MYLWKAWHDSRGRFLMYALAATAIGALLGMFIWADAQWTIRWYDLKPHSFAPGVASRLVRRYIVDFQIPLTLAAAWVALAFASSTVGEGYGDRTMEFVLTRPIARWKIIVTEWLLHTAIITIVVTLLLLAIAPALNALSPAGVRVGLEMMMLLPGTLAFSALVYGTAYGFTLVSGSGMRGMNYTIGIALFLGLFPGALKELWHVDTLANALDWLFQMFTWRAQSVGYPTLPSEQFFPFTQLLLCFGTAAALMVFSMWYLNRREV